MKETTYAVDYRVGDEEQHTRVRSFDTKELAEATAKQIVDAAEQKGIRCEVWVSRRYFEREYIKSYISF